MAAFFIPLAAHSPIHNYLFFIFYSPLPHWNKTVIQYILIVPILNRDLFAANSIPKMRQQMDCKRQYTQFSACGLNCGLCPRFHNYGRARCPGCGGENFLERHPQCEALSCALEHGVEFCCFCDEYPCEKHNGQKIEMFITQRNTRKDLEKFKTAGMEAYHRELEEKMNILRVLLKDYNDGKRSIFYCLAVNLLDPEDLKNVMKKIETEVKLDGNLNITGKAMVAVNLFEAAAREKHIRLKLLKK